MRTPHCDRHEKHDRFAIETETATATHPPNTTDRPPGMMSLNLPEFILIPKNSSESMWFTVLKLPGQQSIRLVGVFDAVADAGGQRQIANLGTQRG
jgi:hypothetical protein